MSLELNKLRERLTTATFEAAKEEDKISFLQDNLTTRIKMKEDCFKHGIKYLTTYQLGLEQTECEIKIREAVRDKYINEIKFLRLEIQELKEKLASQ